MSKRAGRQYGRFLSIVFSGFLALVLWHSASAQTPLGNSGYLDFPYQGWGGPGAPTGEKPQSKLWWNDGFWWGSLYSSANGEFRIHRLNWATQTWEDTGVSIDERESTKVDVVWEPSQNKLYVLSHFAVVSDGKTVANAGKFPRLYRYSYDPVLQIYSLDAGFPSVVNQDEAEAMVLARDSSGNLWTAWVSRGITPEAPIPQDTVYKVYVSRSNDGGLTWGAPLVPNTTPSATAVNIKRGDIASIVSYDNQVAILWNNSNDHSLNLAFPTGGVGAPNGPWTHRVLPVPVGADDHISLQSWQVTSNGIVMAAIKTTASTMDPITQTLPLIGLVAYDVQTDSLAFREYSRNTDKDTRPIVVIDQGDVAQTTDDRVYIFVTGKEAGSKICYKSVEITIPLSGMPQFPVQDCGISFIEDNVYKFINDATSTKQNANGYTGIVVLASDTTTTTVPVGTYVHNVIGNPPPVVTARAPGIGQTGTPLDASVVVTFSKSMDGLTLNGSTFRVLEGANPVAGSVTFDNARTAAFAPSAPLKASTVYTIELSNDVKDATGLRLNAFENKAAGQVVETWQFTTGPGAVQFAASTYSVVESAGVANIIVNLSSASGQPVTVDYATSNGTAAAGSDYTTTSGTLTFNPGETSKTIPVPILDDGATEGDETVNLTLNNPSGATLGAPAAATLTIIDDEGPVTVSFSSAAYTTNEASASATITVSLNRVDAVNTVTVNYATSDGTATAGSDYTSAAGTLTFNPNETVKTFSVPILNDTLDENNETVNLALSNPANAVLGTVGNATLTITDDDAKPTVKFGAATFTAGEAAGSATVTVQLSAPSGLPVTVKYATANGTAAAGSDYTAAAGTLTFNPGETSKTFPVPILNDTLDEYDETVNLSLSDPGNATLGTPFGAVLTITDEDSTQPAVQFAVPAITKGEPSGSHEIEIVLSGPSGKQVAVDYATSDGTATAGADYASASGTVLFAPGQTSATIDLVLIDDALDEEDETINLTLSNPVNATIGAAGSAVFTIDDNDPKPTVQFAAATIAIGEAGGSATAAVQLSAPSGLPVTVKYDTSDGTATAGSDYTATNGDLTFAPGETSKTISVPVLDDALVEPDETINLKLSNPVNATLGAVSSAVITVADDDSGGEQPPELFLPMILKF